MGEAGHTIVAVLVGEGARRSGPDLFQRGFGVAPVSFPSPGLIPDARRRAISKLGTFTRNVLRVPWYAGSLRMLREAARRERPDLVVNFYDLLGGLAFSPRARGSARVVALSSLHYLMDHPQVPLPSGSAAELGLFRLLTRFTAPAGSSRVALSLRPLADAQGPRDSTPSVFPPLLRRAVLDAEPARGDHLLVYLLHHGYARDLARWHESHPEQVVHVFWDRPGSPELMELRPNLICHRPSDTLFLELMRGCRGVVTTAGFQAVAEALWLGKPVMAVPTHGHIEQRWNAQEAALAGAGITGTRFDLSAFLEYLPHHAHATASWRRWVVEGRGRLLRLLEGAAI